MDDAAFLLKLMHTSTLLPWLSNETFNDQQEVRSFLNDKLNPTAINALPILLVRLSISNTAIGICGLVESSDLDSAVMFISLLPEYRAHGYAYEATAALLVQVQKTMHLPRLTALAHAGNTPALILLQKLGLRFERTTTFQGEHLLLLSISLP